MSLSRPLVRRVPLALTGLLAGALVLGGCGGTTASAPAGGIVREALGSTMAPAAPGYQLGLWHYTIPAGSKLVPHHHPGWQMAHLTAGALTYTIVNGTATVVRAGGATEKHDGGETITLATGDTVIESPEMGHYGENRGTVAVELYSSTLFMEDAPVAIPLAEASGATTYQLSFVGTSDAAENHFHTGGKDGSLTYGTGRIAGTASLGSTPVEMEILVALDYVSGSGTFTGYVTATLPGGDALAFSYVGTATTEGEDSTIAGAMQLIGGSGSLGGVSGSGVLAGTRNGPVGSPVQYDITLTLVGMPD